MRISPASASPLSNGGIRRKPRIQRALHGAAGRPPSLLAEPEAHRPEVGAFCCPQRSRFLFARAPVVRRSPRLIHPGGERSRLHTELASARPRCWPSPRLIDPRGLRRSFNRRSCSSKRCGRAPHTASHHRRRRHRSAPCLNRPSPLMRAGPPQPAVPTLSITSNTHHGSALEMLVRNLGFF